MRASDALCRALGSRLRAPTRVPELRHPGCGGSLSGAPRPDTIHHARPAVAAVGLERQLPDEPERLPSDRLEPRGPSRLSGASCSRAAPHPAPGRSLRAWACLVKGRLVASNYPALQRRLAAHARATRKMRLTEFCNRLPSRAPCRLFGSWSRHHPGPRATLRCLVALRPSCDARGGRWLTLGLSLAAARLGCLPIRLAG